MKIIESQDLPEDAKIYLKKDFLGYRIVHPIKDKDGKIIWINLLFGGWRNLVTLVILLALAFWLITYTNNHIAEYKAYCEPISKNPIAFCDKLGYFNAKDKNVINHSFNFNISEVIEDAS